MFIHNFKYSFKTLFKDRILIFWTFLFPIILGTLFSLAFSDIENNEKLGVIDVALVGEGTNVFSQVFDSLSMGDDKLFDVKYVDIEEAREMLDNGDITGYLMMDEDSKVVVNTNGINESVFKYVVDECIEYSNIVNKLAEIKMKDDEFLQTDMNSFISSIYEEVREKMDRSANINDISSRNISYTMIEYYTLIAMSALYGGILSMISINKCLPNMSTKGCRVAVSPVNKRTLIVSSLFASYIVQLIGLIILFIYTIFVLNVDYGSDFLLVMLLSLVGTFAGLSLGVFVCSMFKIGENAKTGVMIAVTMFCCFLSGMMGVTMKYVIDSKVPILNKINPASMITDGFYSLYYYETKERFYFNVISLLIFSFLMIVISIFSLRRQKYDSI